MDGAFKMPHLFLYLYIMINPTEIVPGVIFYAYYSAMRKEKVGFFEHSTLVLQVAGQFSFETAAQKISMKPGEMLLIRKNQLGEIIKMPLEVGAGYETIVIVLTEELLREFSLEEQIENDRKYNGALNILIPKNDFLHGYFQSVLPYVRHSDQKIARELGMMKIREGVKLLLHAMPDLKDFLFDFSEPHKIDLEQFMIKNFHFNIPVEKFARLTGRSLAGFKRDFQKVFDLAPRQWLQEKRLTEARYLIEKKNRKPSDIYLDLGFESLSHFSHAFKKRFGKTYRELISE
jgi:AraC family transcriptional regulator, exoenzyme S synthesis regulatory protein ExsA